MTIGGEELIRRWGSPLAVAEALLEGKIDSYSQTFVSDVVDSVMLKAAEARIRLRRDTSTTVPVRTDVKHKPAKKVRTRR